MTNHRDDDFKTGAIVGVGVLCFVLMLCGFYWAGIGFVVAVALLSGKAVKR
jgi:hypothetical protein